MFFICHGRPIAKRQASSSVPDLASGSTFLKLEPAPALEPAPTNMLLKQLIETYIKLAQDYPVCPRDDTTRFLTPRNPNFYYRNLHMECYYFCQQYNDYLEIKHVLFVADFLKDRILN